jgi:predicted DNA-binding antitoxin AbrB/MazE fold protein
MQQMITAIFEGGMLKPDQRLDLPEHAHVRLIVETLENTPAAAQDALRELDRLCDESPICSTSPRLTRDQLHERR